MRLLEFILAIRKNIVIHILLTNSNSFRWISKRTNITKYAIRFSLIKKLFEMLQ